MKLISMLMALITMGGALVAQNKQMGQSDPNAKKILDAVSTKFKTYKGVQAGFTFTTEDAKGKVQGTKKGTLLMKGTKYRVTLIGGQDIFCDGINIWTYDKAANEVTLSKFDPSQNTITPQKLFTNFYDKDFLYKLNGEKKQGGKTLQEIELTPYDKSKPFFKVYVLVDKAAQTIYSTKVMEKSGNRYTYTVSSLNGNANLQDAQFVFDKKKYPGVEVIDLR
ncbi:MAG TPA: outer membrane lipoprotein carrier protein LolA [Lacibacter sp.]|nr:outer membrane lipoprotein carrier protein LolA [Lacibacter sp.]